MKRPAYAINTRMGASDLAGELVPVPAAPHIDMSFIHPAMLVDEGNILAATRHVCYVMTLQEDVRSE